MVVLLAVGYATPFSHSLLEHKYSINGVAYPFFYLILTFINGGG